MRGKEKGILLRAGNSYPIGTGFQKSNGAQRVQPAARPSRPPTGSMIVLPLIVSTIERQKEFTILLFRGWQRLWKDRRQASVADPSSLPTGSCWQGLRPDGTLYNFQIFIEGKIIHIERPTDAELRRTLRGCLCSFVSVLLRGMGLPVTRKVISFRLPLHILYGNFRLPEAGGGARFDRYIESGTTSPPAYTCRIITGDIQDQAGPFANGWTECRESSGRFSLPWSPSARARAPRLETHPRVSGASETRLRRRA